MVREHHQLRGLEFEQTLEIVDDQGPGGLQSKGSQKVGHDLATEQQQQPRNDSGDSVTQMD